MRAPFTVPKPTAKAWVQATSSAKSHFAAPALNVKTLLRSSTYDVGNINIDVEAATATVVDVRCSYPFLHLAPPIKVGDIGERLCGLGPAPRRCAPAPTAEGPDADEARAEPMSDVEAVTRSVGRASLDAQDVPRSPTPPPSKRDREEHNSRGNRGHRRLDPGDDADA